MAGYSTLGSVQAVLPSTIRLEESQIDPPSPDDMFATGGWNDQIGAEIDLHFLKAGVSLPLGATDPLRYVSAYWSNRKLAYDAMVTRGSVASDGAEWAEWNEGYAAFLLSIDDGTIVSIITDPESGEPWSYLMDQNETANDPTKQPTFKIGMTH